MRQPLLPAGRSLAKVHPVPPDSLIPTENLPVNIDPGSQWVLGRVLLLGAYLWLRINWRR
jgi:hypothetical protein